ncbi:MAG: MFS transporter, partial [Planctomycetia bacterium]
TMGLSTVVIGLLPTYAQIGVAAPLLLALCRFGQGLGVGGEWGGAVLLAAENAPPGKRAWYGMFPQLGAPFGFILSGATFLLLGEIMTDEQFYSFGWRIPFLASILLVAVGLYVRLKIAETPVFQKTLDDGGRVRVPMVDVFRRHTRNLVLGTFCALATFVLFYLMTIFSLSWGTSEKGLGYPRKEFLLVQMFAVSFFALTIPLSAVLADRFGRRATLMAVSAAIAAFGLLAAPLFVAGNLASVAVFLTIGLALMGMTYGPLGTQLSELFPTEVRYTGSSLTFNLAGILGGSLAPYIATWLATEHGLHAVGWYLSAAALLTLIALSLSRETKDDVL